MIQEENIIIHHQEVRNLVDQIRDIKMANINKYMELVIKAEGKMGLSFLMIMGLLIEIDK